MGEPGLMGTKRGSIGEYAGTIGLVAATTAGLVLLRSRLQVTDVAMLYLVPVVAVAARYRRGAALLAAALSVALFDFLFVPPFYTFRVHEPAFFFTFAVMFGVALVMSGLTARIREQKEAADARERRTAALYELSSDLSRAEDRRDIVDTLTAHLGRVTRATATVLLTDGLEFEGEEPRWPADGIFGNRFVRLAASWTYRYGQSSGLNTSNQFDAEAMVVPIGRAGRRIGVAALVPEAEGVEFDAWQIETAEGLAERAALELERRFVAEGRNPLHLSQVAPQQGGAEAAVRAPGRQG